MKSLASIDSVANDSNMDVSVTPGRRRNMQANRSKDTKPELAVRRLLHADGFRYRVNYAPLRGLRRTADIVFPRLRIAVFIDGCFWHSCPQHGHAVNTNASYWGPKLARNHERDQETTAILKEKGWLPIRFWAHDEPEYIADCIEQLVRSLRTVNRYQVTINNNKLTRL